jgi:hypothetical protein
MAGQRYRPWINGFLVGFLALLAIDTCHATGCNQRLKDKANLPLLVTGLWQGPWRLYGPDVPKANLRFKADLVFADQATTTWTSPDWPQVSPPRKFALARHMNYFNNLMPSGEQALRGLCAYLARTVPHPQGKAVKVVQVNLSLRGAAMPPPTEKLIPAAPYLEFDPWQPILSWRPDA